MIEPGLPGAMVIPTFPKSTVTLQPQITFSQAAELWAQSHALHIRSGTRRHYRHCIRALAPFFGALRLDEIRIDHLEQYQKMRSAGEGGLRKAGPSCVNHELNT